VGLIHTKEPELYEVTCIQNTENRAQEASKNLTVKSADTWMIYIVVLSWKQSEHVSLRVYFKDL
jgi:hypothetical protein